MERWRKAIGKWIRWSKTLNSRSTEKVAGEAHFTNVESPSASQTGSRMVESHAAEPAGRIGRNGRETRCEQAKRGGKTKIAFRPAKAGFAQTTFALRKATDVCLLSDSPCSKTEPTARESETGLEVLERIVVTGTEWIRIARWSEWVRCVSSATVKRAATCVGGSSGCVGRCRFGCQRVVHRTFEGIV